MALPEVLKSIVGWMRAGYPEGVPEHDYIPLFALLGSHLTDEDIAAIAAELEGSTDAASAQAIKDAIQPVSAGNPLDADIARVRARLAAGGWPLAMPHERASTQRPRPLA